jgi:hypothetical protein
MTYAQYITKLRTKLKDFGKLHKETFDGDGTTKNFPLTYAPIKDASYTVKVGGVTQTETTHYTIDKDTGIVTFVSAPASGSDNIEVAYQSIKVRDEDYLEFINDAIDHFRWKFWKEADDTTTITTVKDQYEYDLSGLTGILYPLWCWYKTSSSSTVWIAVQSLVNWEWLPRQTKLYVNPPFDTSALPMKFRFLQSFTKGTVTSDTLDIPDEWLLPYEFYVKARYYEQLVSEKIHEVGAVTTIKGFLPGPNILNVVEFYYRKAEEVANKIALKLPPLPIKTVTEGVAM